MLLLIEKLIKKQTNTFLTKVNINKCIIETAIQYPNLLKFYENIYSKTAIKRSERNKFQFA